MKWRPISELSDEQRDGRWWMFAYNDSLSGFVKKYDLDLVGWVDYLYSGDMEISDKEMKAYNYFLSEPLPEFPKPQKMEWRRMSEIRPEEGQRVLIIPHKSNVVIARYERGLFNHESDGLCCKPGGAFMWMPIILPEGE